MAAAALLKKAQQQINVQSLGLYNTVQDIENTVIKSQ